MAAFLNRAENRATRDKSQFLNALIEPIRTRRKQYENRPDEVIDVLRTGTRRANEVAEETLSLAKKAMKQVFFARELRIP